MIEQRNPNAEFDVGVIRVISLENPTEINAHASIISKCAPNFTFLSRCIPDQPNGVHDEKTFSASVPKVVALGQELAQYCRLLVVSCVDDPGVSELRRAVSIPVVGAGEALAASVGDCRVIGLLNLNNEVPHPMRAVGHEVLQASPEGGVTTTDLMSPDIQSFYLREAAKLLDSGAERLVAVCTGMDSAELTEHLSTALGVRVDSPLPAVGLEVRRILKTNTQYSQDIRTHP